MAYRAIGHELGWVKARHFALLERVEHVRASVGRVVLVVKHGARVQVARELQEHVVVPVTHQYTVPAAVTDEQRRGAALRQRTHL